jgi:hypothetical protein
MVAASKPNRMVRVSSFLELQLICDDGNRAVLRGLLFGLFEVVFKFWDAERTQQELGQVILDLPASQQHLSGPNAAAHSLLTLQKCILSAF